jgi:hypothetical protein
VGSVCAARNPALWFRGRLKDRPDNHPNFWTPGLSVSILGAAMSSLLHRRSMLGFILAIFAMGILRFILTIAGLPDSTVKFFSMTVIIMLGTVYFAFTTTTHKERLKAAYWLILPYMIVEVAALGYTWATSRHTIFHAQEYSFGSSLPVHFLGHLIGGLTWEPLSVFLVMELIWLIGRLFGRKSRNPEPQPG